MFRNFIRLGKACGSLGSPASNIRFNYGRCLQIPSRQFNSELSANWPESIKSFLAQEKIEQPTIIQEKTLPLAMDNRDLVGIARTGSGKTLAFVIPAVMKILKEREADPNFVCKGEKLPTCLILAPTRELASQTADVFKKFRKLGIRSIVLVGGASRSEQMRELAYRDQDVYIATPGRLMDLMDSGIVDLSNIKYLVFDEADRMLDMGFEPQIRKVVEKIPEKRQTLMWSATWPMEIQSLAKDFMNNYEYVAVDSEKLKANPNINQIVEVCEQRDKLDSLLNHLARFKDEAKDPRILIFVNTKRLADQLLMQLMRNRYRCISMHGDRTQQQRENALRMFKDRSCNIMVATDVAARGLDISDITHVVNYDLPTCIEDYIHRIGRTARHEKKGTSVSLFTTNNINIVDKLVQVLRETNQEVPRKLEELARDKHHYVQESPRRARMPRNDFYSNRRSQPSRYNQREHNVFDDEFDQDRQEYPNSYRGGRRSRGGSMFEDRD